MGTLPTQRQVRLISKELNLLAKPNETSNVFDLLGIYGKELPISNYLAHLFDTNRSHGCGQLFLEILLELVIQKLPSKSNMLSKVPNDNYLVLREKNNIDILITEEAGKWAIIIENKVYHHLNNDFERYIRSTDVKNYIAVIFSLFKHAKPSTVNSGRICCVTYKEFITALEINKKRISDLMKDENEIYLFNELKSYFKKLTKMSNYSEEEMKLLEFYEKHYDEMNKIYDSKRRAEKIIVDITNSVIDNLFQFEVSKKGSFIEGKHYYASNDFKTENPDYRDQFRFYVDYSEFFKSKLIYFVIELYLDSVKLYNQLKINEIIKGKSQLKLDNAEGLGYKHVVSTEIKFSSFASFEKTLHQTLRRRFIENKVFETLIRELNKKSNRLKQ